MRFACLGLFVVSIVGCGPDYSGKYEGALTVDETCSHGDPAPIVIQDPLWTFVRDGAGWKLDAGRCKGIPLQSAGAAFLIPTPHRCATETDEFGTYTITYGGIGNTILTDGPRVTFNLVSQVSAVDNDGFRYTCTGFLTRTLTRVGPGE